MVIFAGDEREEWEIQILLLTPTVVAKASQLLIVDAEKLNLGSRPTWKIHSHLHIQSIEDH